MKFLSLLVSLVVTMDSLYSADLKTFTDPRAAISAARADRKLIVFLIADAKSKDHQPIAAGLETELERLHTEFILVKCSHSVKSSRDLFSGRFGKDLTKMPVAVVSNASGEEITFHQGVDDLEGYERMIITSRIKGGLVTDPVKLANLKENLENVGRIGGFLAPMVKDLKRDKKAITEIRDWTRKDGTVFQALLFEALGDTGVFVDGKGNSTKVKFVDLSAEDIEYLQTILRVEKSQ